MYYAHIYIQITLLVIIFTVYNNHTNSNIYKQMTILTLYILLAVSISTLVTILSAAFRSNGFSAKPEIAITPSPTLFEANIFRLLPSIDIVNMVGLRINPQQCIKFCPEYVSSCCDRKVTDSGLEPTYTLYNMFKLLLQSIYTVDIYIYIYIYSNSSYA